MKKGYVIVREITDGKFEGQKHYQVKGGYVRNYGTQLFEDEVYSNKKYAEALAKRIAKEEKTYSWMNHTTRFSVEEVTL